MDRRSFIYKAGRGGMLAALAVTAGILAGRGQVTGKKDCTLSRACQDCRILEECGLPRALKEKKGSRE